MPIRLNLLAEARAEEEQRRNDPVKRIIWIGVLAIIAVLVWSSSLQVRALVIKGELNRMEAVLQANTNAYAKVLENQAKTADIKHKMVALRQLATNRFLHGPVMNALQQATVDDVQLTRLRTEQVYVSIELPKTSTNASSKSVKGGAKKAAPKPAKVTEKITITLDAKDTTEPTPGDNVTRFKDVLAGNPFFAELLGQTNEVRLANLSAPQPGQTGKSYVTFTLECKLPEKTR